MDEMTKTLNNGCYYLTLKYGDTLYLNACAVVSYNPTTTPNGRQALLVVTERGKQWAVMDADYYTIDTPTAADVYNHCSQVKSWGCY